MFEQFLDQVESVATQDSSNLVLWIVIGVAALLLVVGSAVMSALSKKNKKDDDDK